VRESQESSDVKVSLLGQALSGCHIALCVGGGIGAVEAPRVARELRRYGARVQIFATENALRFVGQVSLEWASGEALTVQPSGLAEHVFEGDLILVAPATTDLLAKAAQGLCVDGVTTLIQSALGLAKTVFFSASHA
jgi:phosphopantothenoylcysteine decarboxylase / phosphopantothenate---cysteine ligase